MTPVSNEAARTARWRSKQDPETLKQRNREALQRHRRRYSAWIATLKTACLDCGSHERLHFHHRDPATKLFNISGGQIEAALIGSGFRNTRKIGRTLGVGSGTVERIKQAMRAREVGSAAS
jgi:hypothetical protein